MNRGLALLTGAIIISVLLSGCGNKKREEVEKVICSECGVEIDKAEATVLVRGKDTVYFYPEECKYRYLERYGDARCAVCGSDMTVTLDTKYVIYEGETYLMCSEGCKTRFTADPEKYMKKIHEEMYEGK